MLEGVRTPLLLVVAILVAGCGASKPKNAQGHLIGSAMGKDAPVYSGAGEPMGEFLAGRWVLTFGGPTGSRTADVGLIEADNHMILSQTFDVTGHATYGVEMPGKEPLLRKGTWRLNGENVEIAYDEAAGDASNPTWTMATQALSTTFTTPLRVDADRRRLKLVSQAVPDGNTPKGKILWARVWR